MFRRPLLILALVLATACSSPAASVSSSPTPTPAPTPSPSPTKSAVPAGWTTVARTSDGFSISIPPSWRAIDMDPQTMSSAFKTMVDQNPAFAQTYSVEQMQALVQQGIKMMAFDFGSGGHTNFNVLQQTLPSEMSASVFSQLAASQVEVQLNIATPKNEPAIVGNLDARVVMYDLALQTPNGVFNASFSQYIAIHGKNAYVITFTNRAEDAAGNRALFDQIAATFALSP